jgi:hypothetical protein
MGLMNIIGSTRRRSKRLKHHNRLEPMREKGRENARKDPLLRRQMRMRGEVRGEVLVSRRTTVCHGMEEMSKITGKCERDDGALLVSLALRRTN